MDQLPAIEYQTLRQTISSRGTARLALFLAGLGLWVVSLLAILIALPNPIVSIVPLIVLVATFEIVRSLNAGVERIGRYLQVFHETAAPGRVPTWEHTALLLGPRVPGAGGHPLFLPVFVMATLANFLAVLLPGPVLAELVVTGIVHLAFIAWTIAADRAMRGQRGRELDAFRALKEKG